MRYIKFNIKITSIIIMLLFTISFFTSLSSVQAAVIGDFGFSEIISDSLPASATGYACATCTPAFYYNCPAGYARSACNGGYPNGSHNCCGWCIVIRATCTLICVPSCPGGCGDVGQSDGCTGTCPDNTGNVCDDGNAGTFGDVCTGGICAGVACPGFGNPCNRNVCGGTGTILCDGSCSAVAPTIYDEDTCNRNACGGTGFINKCTGVCSEVAIPCTIICGDGLVEGLEICDTLGSVGCFSAAPVCTPTGDFTCGTCHAASGSDPLIVGGKPVVDTVKDITTYILSITGSIALLILIIGGIYYIVSGSNPDGQLKAKKIIVFALLGLTLILVSYAMLTVIDNFVVN